MKTHRIFMLAGAIAVALACSTLSPSSTPSPLAPTPAGTPTIRHFENEWLSFDYPDDMQLAAGAASPFAWYPDVDLEGEQLVALGDPRFHAFETYFRWLRITRRPFLVEQDLAETIRQMYVPLESKYSHPGTLTEPPAAVTISGLPAYEKRYGIFSGEPLYRMRDIWVYKDGALYIISIGAEHTNAEDNAAFEARIDAILESLVIK